MSSTPPPGDGYGQPDYGQPAYNQPSYGDQSAQSGYGQPGHGAQPAMTEPPKSVKMAINLIWARIALSVLSTLLTFVMIDSILDKAMEDAGVSASFDSDATKSAAYVGAVFGLVVGVGVAIALLLFIKKGANWARITYTVLTAIGLALGLVGLLTGSSPAILMILSLVYMVLGAAALWFLWQKDSNAWFAQHS